MQYNGVHIILTPKFLTTRETISRNMLFQLRKIYTICIFNQIRLKRFENRIGHIFAKQFVKTRSSILVSCINSTNKTKYRRVNGFTVFVFPFFLFFNISFSFTAFQKNLKSRVKYFIIKPTCFY